MARILQRFFRAEDGVVAVLFLVLLPLFLFLAGLAIDLASLTAERRYVQGQADLAALAAVRHLDSASDLRGAARRTIAAHDRYATLPTPDEEIEIGDVGPGGFQRGADPGVTAGHFAVRVTVRARAQMYLLPFFLPPGDLVVARAAVAGAAPRVSFALSNCAMSGRLLVPALRQMIGAAADLLCSGQGLDSRISVEGFLMRLQARVQLASREEARYGDLLAAEVPVAAVLGAALNLPVEGGDTPIRLGDALILSPDLRQLRLGQPLPPLALRASDIAFASVELMGQRLGGLQVDLTLASAGTVRAHLAVGMARQLVLGVRPGEAQARAESAQIAVELPQVAIADLFTLSLSFQAAHAEVRLTGGQACGQEAQTEVALFDPAEAQVMRLQMALAVPGLPLAQASLGQASRRLGLQVSTRAAFTRLQARTAPWRDFGPSPTLEAAALTAQMRAEVAAMLDQASTAIAGGTCGSGGSCATAGLVSTALGPVTGLASLASALGQSADQVRTASGSAGTQVQALMQDLLSLGLAQARLDLLEAECAERPRLLR